MNDTPLDRQSLRQLVCDMIRAPDFRRATFGGAARGVTAAPWVRVIVRPVEVRGGRRLQFSYFDRRKNVTKNYGAEEIQPALDQVLDAAYAGIHLSAGA